MDSDHAGILATLRSHTYIFIDLNNSLRIFFQSGKIRYNILVLDPICGVKNCCGVNVLNKV